MKILYVVFERLRWGQTAFGIGYDMVSG